MNDIRGILLRIAVDESWRADASVDREISDETWATLISAATHHRLLPSLALAWSDDDSYRGTLARRLMIGFRAVDEQRREQYAELLSALESASIRQLSDAKVADTVRNLAWTRGPQGQLKLAPEGLYGRRKMLVAVRNAGTPATPGAVDRAMRQRGLSGVRRGTKDPHHNPRLTTANALPTC